MKKMKIPSKQTLNLMVEVRTLAHPTRLIPILLIMFIAVGLFARFAVVGRLDSVRQAKAELSEMKKHLEAIESSYADFDEVQMKYNQYTYQSFDRTIPDRLDVLAMIERQLFTVGTVKNISISGRTVSLTLEGPDLGDISDLYAALCSEPLVDDVAVSSYNEQHSSSGASSIAMTIYLADAAAPGIEEDGGNAGNGGGE